MRRNSIASNWRIEPWIILALGALVAVLFYLIVSEVVFQIGFPLDDAWIHLTYARNVAQHGAWAFRLGQHSAGSTSPLWTALLSIGFLMGLAPYVWTYLLGWAVLTLLALCSETIARKLVNSYKPPIPWAGLFFVFAWHLTWSAVSGMETLLHALDGLTLLGPILFTALLSERTWHSRGEALWKTLLGFGALFFPYVLFNLMLSGNPMPSTFYAKRAEYGAYWLSQPLTVRIGDYLSPVLASPFVVLIPGAIWWLSKQLRARNWGALASLLWCLGYIGIYFSDLPAYQHGRYIIPALPILYLWGILGFFKLASLPEVNKHLVSLWQITALVLVMSFEIIGARQNAYDVLWVETEMVQTAKWVEQNVPPDALLAVHDIGALGFYTANPVIDLAGLTTPDVIPFIRNEDHLANYLDSQSVDYLVTFPSFYPQLTSKLKLVFQAGPQANQAHFPENMQVFRWK
jgi:hypothetical protein